MADTNRGCMIAGIAAGVLGLLLACAGLVAAGWFYFAKQEGTIPHPVPVPAAPGVPQTPGIPPKPEGAVRGGGVVDDDLVLAAEAMYLWPEGDQATYPYQVDGVEVRGSRAIGNYTPVTRDGRPDPNRPGGLFVAHKVNGRWQVYALGTDIINPWAEPIERIYGTP